MLILELNEFNPKLLFDAAEAYGYQNILRLKQLHVSATYSKDTYDSGYLEPWVQWVSVHTGTSSSEHKIKHLGDITMLKHEQLWEKLSRVGVTTGVWGVLNGRRGDAENCLFFLPDPWTFSEPGYPHEINYFLALPRYMARNYLNANWFKVFQLGVNFLRFVLSPRVLVAVIRELPRVLIHAVRFRAANFVPYSVAEYLSTLRFIEYRQKFNPQCSILFLNLIAHVQHYYWQDVPLQRNKRLKYAMHYLDRILGALFASKTSEDRLVVVNALSQMNTNHEEPWILYRQKDHTTLLHALGIPNVRVEAGMTHDALLFFPTAEACAHARSVLTATKTNGEPLFSVEAYENDPQKLFYMIQYTKIISNDQSFDVDGRIYNFADFFCPVIQRTAKHIGAGVAYSDTEFLPPKFENHTICHYIVEFFKKKQHVVAH